MAKAPDAAGVVRGAGPASKKKPRFRIFLVVCALVAAAFGGGALWGHLRARADRSTWQKERTTLEERLAALEGEVATARAQAVVHRLDEALSKVLVDLAEKNYGLARDEAAALARTVSSAAADLPAAWRGGLDQAASLLDEAARAADALSPDARARTVQARETLRQLAAGAPSSQ